MHSAVLRLSNLRQAHSRPPRNNNEVSSQPHPAQSGITQALLADAQHAFGVAGYCILRSVLSPREAELISSYALLQCVYPDYYLAEPLTQSQGRYCDAMGETLLIKLHGLMQQVAAAALEPCYSYLRIYRPGAVLEKHIDRDSCEVSASMTLGFQAQRNWPLWLEDAGQSRALELAPGDLLLYRGADLPHWRERFDGQFWVQLFLHYVRSNGRFAGHRFDGREQLGPFDPERQRRKLPSDAATPAGSAGEAA